MLKWFSQWRNIVQVNQVRPCSSKPWDFAPNICKVRTKIGAQNEWVHVHMLEKYYAHHIMNINVLSSIVEGKYEKNLLQDQKPNIWLTKASKNCNNGFCEVLVHFERIKILLTSFKNTVSMLTYNILMKMAPRLQNS